MSHFTVMVIGAADETELAELLAPFDEGREVTPYFEPMSAEDVARMAAHYKAAPTFAALAPHADDWNGSALVEVDGRIGHMSTYNPDSKWDYWRIGGRWAGHLRLKVGVNAAPPDTSGYDWRDARPDELPGEGRSDIARVADIDFEGWRMEAAMGADSLYDRYEKLVAEWGEVPKWSPPGRDADGSWQSLEAYRATYNATPAVVASGETFADHGPFFSAGSEFGGLTREAYIAKVVAAAVPCYATLIKGEGWFAPGKMGWFGASSVDDDDRARYHAKVNMILDAADPETMIHVIDCHI